MTCAFCAIGPPPFRQTEVDGRWWTTCSDCCNKTAVYQRPLRPKEMTSEFVFKKLKEASPVTASGLAERMRVQSHTINVHLHRLKAMGKILWKRGQVIVVVS